MNILMVSAEAVPFAKTGGLADAVSALSAELAKYGHDVRAVLPRYYAVSRDALKAVRKSVRVNIGWQEISVDFYEAELPGKVPVYFVDYEKCFGRDGIYGSPFEPDYRDNPFRFSVFARSAFALCRTLDWIPDIMHAHDWPACMVPVLLKSGAERGFWNTASVLTIHNLGYQGIYPAAAFRLLGIGEDLGSRSGLLSEGGVHFLKAGISCADKITTVSPTYAKEICTPEGGFGLDGLLRVRSDSLSGIVNGADTEAWNPSSDAYIPFHYSDGDMAGKMRCKAALQKEFRLPESERTPLVAMVTRLAEQKGIAEVFAPMYGAMYRMCTELDVQFAVVGSGERWCEDEIRALQEKLPNLRAFIGYNEALGHRAEAGADFFLMPSRYEPCGLNQIYSQLYGAVPIVRATGGLADTVLPFVSKDMPGTGFLFDVISPDAVFHAVQAACALYAGDRQTYERMQAAGMRRTFGWSASAARYLSVYESALSGRGPSA